MADIFMGAALILSTIALLVLLWTAIARNDKHIEPERRYRTTDDLAGEAFDPYKRTEPPTQAVRLSVLATPVLPVKRLQDCTEACRNKAYTHWQEENRLAPYIPDDARILFFTGSQEPPKGA